MHISTQQAEYLLIILICINLILFFAILYRKNNSIRHDRKKATVIDYIVSNFIKEDSLIDMDYLKKNRRLIIEGLVEVQQSFSKNNSALHKLAEALIKSGAHHFYIKKLRSYIKYHRINAAVILGHMPCEQVRQSLENAFNREREYSIRIFMAYSLAAIGNFNSIPVLVNSLAGSPDWYRVKMNVIISSFNEKLHQYILGLENSDDSETQQLIIYFASVYQSEYLKKILLDKTGHNNIEIARSAVASLLNLYPWELNNDSYYHHKDLYIRQLAVKSLAKKANNVNIQKLIYFLNDKQVVDQAIFSLLIILNENPKYTDLVINRFTLEKNLNIKKSLVKVLSSRIEYILLGLIYYDKKRENIKSLIEQIVLNGNNSNLIGFLNKNKNIELENEVLRVLNNLLATHDNLRIEFCTYLDQRMLKKIGYEKLTQPIIKRDEKAEKEKVIFLLIILTSVILVFPAIYIMENWQNVFFMSFPQNIYSYIFNFNYYLVYYGVAINSIYMIVLIFSYAGVLGQDMLWKSRQFTFFFEKGMLPSISIIAPAFCEENTIIESINSLLNLKYSNYEVIVVNDGSTDNTLERLISYYELEKVDLPYESHLRTQPVRGLYMNKYITKLKVIDKDNGGKADSLNAGINVAESEYFCAIDADSLLQPDALLKAASLLLYSEDEVVAVGGNIFPINGCQVNKGSLVDIKVPKNILARFQTIEYIRAFMAGRLGWAYINSLLIISGAFGIFKRDRIIESGGYLTRVGKYAKDTVGEDMELIVRLSRYMREKRLRYKINYSFNANCWTEVPEKFNILHRQRDRWHRGLIEIMFFHRKIVLKPNYGTTGMIAMPYFFVFEMIGPLVEIQGYIMVILAFLLGLLNYKLALLLFISNIMMAILVSIASILIAEKDIVYFRTNEVVTLILLAIAENFGFRQVISFLRVTSYFNSMRKPRGWGKMERKGFTPQNLGGNISYRA